MSVAAEMPGTRKTPGRSLADPEHMAQVQAARRLKRELALNALQQVQESDGETPLPATARAGVITAAATIAQDAQADIKDRVSALTALTKLTERHDTGNDFATSELIEFLRRIPR